MNVQEKYQRLEDTVRSYNPGANFDLIRSAFLYAEEHHRGQNRKDGSPFVTHPLAVAQIVAEELHLDSESIAAALLHDIGRHLQYTQNIPHDRASAQLAEVILADCGFSQAERAEVENAILQHRGRQDRQREGLAGLLYGADKASRACLFCPAEPECNWSPEKKNMTIKK